MATIQYSGWLFKDDGTAVDGATVQLYEQGSTTTVGSSVTTGDSSWADGYWEITTTQEPDSTGEYYAHDVKITSGSSVRYLRGKTRQSFAEVDIRNATGATQGGLLVANNANTASNKVATFANRMRTGQANDEIYLSFEMMNDADVIHEFARMTVVAKDVTSSGNTEDGEIQFDVMKSGNLTKVWTISSSTSGATSMDMDIDSFTIGTGADTDVTLTFDANTSDGVITWMEDEDYFQFSDDILMNSTEKINFGDTGTFIHQSSDGVLTIESDTTVDINGAVALNGAITGATNITLSGELDAATLDISGNADIDGTLEADAITINGTAIGSIYGVVAGSSSIVTTGALDSGSITSGFGNIDTGSSTITTTGAADLGATTVDSLTSTGTITGGSDGSGVDVVFYSATSGDNFTWDASEEKLIITGTDGATSLDVADGNVTIADNLTVGGTLTVNGTTTTVNSTTVTVDDPIFTLGGDTAPGSDDNKDRGIEFRYHDGSSARIGFFGYDDSAGIFTGFTAASNSSEVFSGTVMGATFGAITGTTIDASTDFTVGSTVITDDSIVMTPSTSDTVTIAGATNGALNITTVDNAATAANLTATIDGAITLDAASNIELDSATGIFILEDGGTEVLRITEGNSGDVTIKTAVDGKDLIFTDNGDATNMKILDAAAGINVPGEVQTTKIAYTDGDDAITIADGGGVTFAQNTTFSGIIDITDSTDSSDATGDTGALRTEGGASIAKKLYVGTDLDVDGTAELDNITIGGSQGSDGQVLTSTGSGVAWEDAASGGISAGKALAFSIIF